jgi:hypothetical protein
MRIRAHLVRLRGADLDRAHEAVSRLALEANSPNPASLP